MKTIFDFLSKKSIYYFILFASTLMFVAFLMAPLINRIVETSTHTEQLTLTDDSILYATKGDTTTALQKLSKDDTVTILSSDTTWAHVQTASGMMGWIQLPSNSTHYSTSIDVAVTTSQQASIYAQKNGKELTTVPAYSHFLLLFSASDGWLQIQYNNQVAWIQKSDVSISAIATVVATEQAPASLKESASSSSQTLASLKNGDVIQLLNTQNADFALVSYKGQTGYLLHSAYTESVGGIREIIDQQASLPKVVSATKVVYPKLNNTSLLSEPDWASTSIETLSSGTLLTYIDTQGDYFKVKTPSGNTGYIPYWLALVNFATTQSDSSIPTSLSNATIVIDAGHGGEDPGAVTTLNTTTEAQATLSTAQHLKELLQAKGATVILTRTSDTTISLSERATISNQSNADVFISLHFDSNDTGDISGTSVYYYRKVDYNLASVMAKYLAMNLPIQNSGAIFGDLLVLRENTQPALLLELGYLNNLQDNRLIITEDYQRQVAETIVQALEEYFNN